MDVLTEVSLEWSEDVELLGKVIDGLYWATVGFLYKLMNDDNVRLLGGSLEKTVHATIRQFAKAEAD